MKKMNKEKVRELADYMFFNMPIYTRQHAFNAITEWLEQTNLVEKNMFDWTDGEVEGFAIELVGEGFSNLHEVIANLQSMFKAMRRDFDKAKSKPSLSNGQVYSELYQEYQDVKKELEQLNSQQFQPNWESAPIWANWLTPLITKSSRLKILKPPNHYWRNNLTATQSPVVERLRGFFYGRNNDNI